MSTINDGGPAFPTGERLDRNGQVEQYHVGGMSLRDWFAAMALQGQAHRFDSPHARRELLASDCYEVADAMLAARERKGDA